MSEEAKKKEIRMAVQEAMKEIMADMRPMPVAAPVTEIIIRVGSSEAVRVVGGGERLSCPVCPSCIETSHRLTAADVKSVDPDAYKVIKRILKEAGCKEEQVFLELEGRVIAHLVAEQLRKDEPKRFEELEKEKLEKEKLEKKT